MGGGVTVNSVNGVNFGSGALSTTAQSVIGSINEIHESVGEVPQITIGKESNGYIKIGDILIQWGSYDKGIDKDSTASIKYPQPFTTRAVPIATVFKNGNSYSRSTIISTSLTGFTFRTTDNWMSGFYWQAIGY